MLPSNLFRQRSDKMKIDIFHFESSLVVIKANSKNQ